LPCATSAFTPHCRYAQNQVGGAGANEAAVNAGVAGAAVGTLVGAAAGAAIGGGHEGAGAGAGAGLVAGTMAGTGAAQRSANATQQNYDNAYTQCMYAKGEQVSIPSTRIRNRAPAPAGAVYRPPPPGTCYAPPESQPR